jgi:hypothetical protein
MPVQWRPPGGTVGTVDLRRFEGDQIVIHFGGALTSVDAYTFGNSLVAFADVIRSVNAVLNPGQNIEVRLEAIGPGSFRAVVKRLTKGFGGIFSRGLEQVFWGLVAILIYEKLLAPDPHPQIVVNTNEVIIRVGGDTIIVPRTVYDQSAPVRSDPEVQRHLSRTFEVIERDEAVENFGLTPDIGDKEPLIQISRDNFSQLASTPSILETDSGRRERIERVRLIILKAWFTRRGSRKWSFEWNGVPISAPIKDDEFWNKLDARQYLIGQGDALDVRLKYQQIYDDALGVCM